MALALSSTTPSTNTTSGQMHRPEDNTILNNESGTTNSVHPPDPHHYSSIDMDTLMEGLLLLREFASLDSLSYQTSFAFPKNAFSRTCEEEKCRRALQRLEQLQSQKSFQATPLPGLWTSLHRLHSNLAILQENEAKHAAEVRGLREDLKKSMRENHKLQKAIRTLSEQNRTVKQKLLEKRSLLKQARDLFRSSQELQKELEEENAIFKLQAHEQFLSRIRLESSDSNFSDADALLFPDNVVSSHSHNNGYLPSDLRTLPAEEEEEGGDLASLHSSGSSITEDGVSVLKLVPHDDLMTSSSVTANSSHYSDVSESSDQDLGSSCHVPGGPLKHPASAGVPGVYKLQFPHGQKTGLRFQSIPLHELPLPPKGLLTQEFLLEEDEEENEEVVSNVKRQSLFQRSMANLTKEPEPPRLRGRAFIVAGYVATDDMEQQLPKPTLGARVLEIDGQPVDPDWSMRKFLDALRSASGCNNSDETNASSALADDKTCEVEEESKDSKTGEAEQETEPGESTRPREIVTDDEASAVSSIGDKKRTFSLTFRNDALTKKQRERLASADKDNDKKSSSSNLNNNKKINDTTESAKREHRHFGLGFLRLGGDNNNKGSSNLDNKKEQNTKEQNEEQKDNNLEETTTKEPDTSDKKGDRLSFLRLGGNHERKEEQRNKSSSEDHANEKKEDRLGFLRMGGGEKGSNHGNKNESTDKDGERKDDRFGFLWMGGGEKGSNHDKKDLQKQKETKADHAAEKKEDRLGFLRMGGEKGTNHEKKEEPTGKENEDEQAAEKKEDRLGFLRLGGGEKASNHGKQDVQKTRKEQEQVDGEKDESLPTTSTKGRNPLFFWERGGGNNGDKIPKQQQIKQEPPEKEPSETTSEPHAPEKGESEQGAPENNNENQSEPKSAVVEDKQNMSK
ncbi:hypothetical protein ACA910_002085 [Epithemia clementina (nom. ined.)]